MIKCPCYVKKTTASTRYQGIYCLGYWGGEFDPLGKDYPRTWGKEERDKWIEQYCSASFKDCENYKYPVGLGNHTKRAKNKIKRYEKQEVYINGT